MCKCGGVSQRMHKQGNEVSKLFALTCGTVLSAMLVIPQEYKKMLNNYLTNNKTI